MTDLYYLQINTKDEKGDLVPMVVAVEADNEDDARALLLDSFADLVATVDFGELRKARRGKHGYVFTTGVAYPFSQPFPSHA